MVRLNLISRLGAPTDGSPGRSSPPSFASLGVKWVSTPQIKCSTRYTGNDAAGEFRCRAGAGWAAFPLVEGGPFMSLHSFLQRECFSSGRDWSIAQVRAGGYGAQGAARLGRPPVPQLGTPPAALGGATQRRAAKLTSGQRTRIGVTSIVPRPLVAAATMSSSLFSSTGVTPAFQWKICRFQAPPV